MTTTFEVSLPEPVDMAASLEFFRRSGDDLLDRWDGHRALRTVPTGDCRFIPYVARISSDRSLRVTVNHAQDRSTVEPAVAGTFMLAGDHFTRIAASDPVIGELDHRHPGIRPALQHDLLAALIRSISAQQINLAWAATVRRRLAQRFGVRHSVDGEEVYSLDASILAAADPAAIRDLQFTSRKAECVIAVARAFVDGRLSLERLRSMPDEEVIRTLVEIKGIGRWSAEWILCRTLGRPRVVAGDLGVRKAVGLAYLEGAMPTEEQVRDLTAHWGESASIAQALLLHALALSAT